MEHSSCHCRLAVLLIQWKGTHLTMTYRSTSTQTTFNQIHVMHNHSMAAVLAPGAVDLSLVCRPPSTTVAAAVEPLAGSFLRLLVALLGPGATLSPSAVELLADSFLASFGCLFRPPWRFISLWLVILLRCRRGCRAAGCLALLLGVVHRVRIEEYVPLGRLQRTQG